jgi:ribosomal protein L37AE/L43A
MAKTANCPSCGAPVTFKAAASAFAICEFCHSTLVRQDDGVKNIGRMADLLDDDSPIQIGSEGRLRALHFAVVGRIQLKYDAGFWNEWHILLDDGRSAWLSEAGGQYTVTQLTAVPEPIPDFFSLKPGSRVMLRGRQFTVNDLETARCIAGAGELPFKVDAGYDVHAADLRSEHHFASIDYSETPPLVFVGESLAFPDLHLTNLREANAAAAPTLGRGMVKSFACPKCGAPLAVHAKQIEVVVCPSCNVSVDANDPNYRIIAGAAMAARAARVEPLLPFGQKGRLAGSEWEAIGFMRRQTVVEGMPYRWSEYLLHEPTSGFAWLTEYDGHWTLARTIADVPRTVGADPERHIGGSAAWWQQQEFKHFQSGIAEVVYVIGEFYWKVKVGEKVRVHDFVAPPRMLSEERGDNEITWSIADYIEPADIWQAFKLEGEPPPRRGIGACQPNPHAAAHQRTCSLFWKLSAAAFALQLGFALFFGGSTVFKETLLFHAGNNETANTAAFTLARPAHNLYLQNHTDLDNAWLELNMNLVNQQTGESYGAGREISRYHGVDGGESWSEGDRDDSVSLGEVPAGTYYLAIDADVAPELRDRVVDNLTVVRDKTGWTNWFLLQGFLAIFPLLSRWRLQSAETRRWAESDHAPDESGGDD